LEVWGFEFPELFTIDHFPFTTFGVLLRFLKKQAAASFLEKYDQSAFLLY